MLIKIINADNYLCIKLFAYQFNVVFWQNVHKVDLAISYYDAPVPSLNSQPVIYSQIHFSHKVTVDWKFYCLYT